MSSSPRRFDWRNLAIRAASAAVLIPVALGAVWFGGAFFLVFLAAALAVLALEWGDMSAPAGRTRAAAVLVVAILAAVFTAYSGWIKTGWLILLAAAGIATLLALVLRLNRRRPTDVGLGVLYLGAPALALFWLRAGHPREPGWDGVQWTLLLLAVTWAADSFAFLGGSLLKGPKLWPRFSPNKTWSGFVTGLLAATVAAVAAGALLWPDSGSAAKPAAFLAIAGLLGGLATMGGDLLESMLKRRFGVKDSGDLIPGHGGLLDRVDGLMFAVLAMAAVRFASLAEGFG